VHTVLATFVTATTAGSWQRSGRKTTLPS
jgi:hypothetical protein